VRLGGALRVVPVASACFVLEVVIVRYRGIDLVREASEPLGKGDLADVFSEGVGQRIGV
jgi:hypothetical protein